MAAGTLSVTNNSKAVVGAGTTFTAFTAGDFLTLVVGQVPYTVAIASVESDTALTLVLPFDGPTATDLAWDGVKRDTMSLATMGVTVQAQKALRLMIADENNWRAIFGDEEEITVTLPNGQVMQGMSWGYLSRLMKEVDPVEMRNLQQQAAASEAAAQGFRNEAEGFKNDSNTIKTQTDQIKADTQAIHDATNTIKTQTDQIKTDTQAIKDQTNQIKTDTGVMRDEANTAKTDAQAASTAAQGFRDQAEEWAQSVNADNLLTKSGNLAGLTDKPQAWLNVRPDGATPLAGDPVGDYDAATKRWVQNLVNTGTVGPTMNGVMNYGVGDFHLRDSRAYIQPYEVFSDGQLLNRADWPELWAYAQMLSPIADADWLADPANRGKYSLGDGTTTFRVPDRNGVQPGSVPALFGRGDGGTSSYNGKIEDSAAPNITGSFTTSSFTYAGQTYSTAQLRSGAFTKGGSVADSAIDISSVTSGQLSYGTDFYASNSSPIYGRSNQEVRPRSFYGVWVIRASGGFVAANTSWSVINGDASATPDTYVSGGQVMSKYQVNGVDRAIARMSADWRVGDAYQSTIHFYNNATDSGGTAITDAHYYLSGPSGYVLTDVKTGLGDKGGISVGVSLNANDFTTNGIYAGAGDNGVNWGDQYAALLHMSRYEGSSQRAQLQISPTGLLKVRGATATTWSAWSVMQAQGTSGREFKRDITPADPKEALDRIASQDLVTFIYNDDEQERVRFGIIAEDAEKIAPQYIKHDEETVEVDGEVVTRDRPRVDINPIVMDLMGCVQYLNKQIEDLKAEIAALKK